MVVRGSKSGASEKRAAATSAVPKRKRENGKSAETQSETRAQRGAEEEKEPLALFDGDASDQDGELALEEDDEASEAEADDSEDDGELDPFPEIDLGTDGEDEQDNDDSEDDEEEEELGEQSSEEEGYDSDEIDNWNESDEDQRAEEFANRETDESEIENELKDMMKRASGKPVESEPQINKLGMTPNESATPVFGKDRNRDGSALGQFRTSEITGQPKRVYPSIDPGYESDSSTEDAPNRIGNVPEHWYDEFPHIGYDVEGRKVMRPATGDELDKFLATVEDPESWMTAKDKLTGSDVRLTDEELDIIRRLQNAEIPDATYDTYEPTIEWYTGKGMELQMPLSGRPEPKSRFVPSKWEHKKVMKIVRAIRQGRITPRGPASTKPQFYNIWTDADQPAADHPMHMPAPKLALPTHAESYNPPAEYLFDEAEREEWDNADPSDRKTNFMPAKFDALRKVPGYQNFVKERFERCLDLYLAPRMRRQRLDIEHAQDLLPKLPSPRDLRPFPSATSITFEHPNDVRVRCVSVDPFGQWLVTGADDGRVRLWDLAIGRCTAVWDICASSATANGSSATVERNAVFSVAWCPNKQYSLFVACSAGQVTVIVPPQLNGAAAFASAVSTSKTSRGINWTSASMAFATQGYQPATAASADDAAKQASIAQWTRPSDAQRRQGVAAIVHVKGTPKQVVWHTRGDYFATTNQRTSAATQGEASASSSTTVLIHQLSKQRTQAPFAKASKGSAVQAVLFHPSQPHFFVATQRTIRIYNLATQTLLKTLQTGLRWISSMHVHGPSGGSHLIVGSYDKRVAWFDLELGNRPYKILRYHQRAVRAVQFHNRYPLLMSAGDDGNVHILHATVYNDVISNPLIVPLKVLRGHALTDGLGILDASWHPTMPWLVTAGADGEARLWTP